MRSLLAAAVLAVLTACATEPSERALAPEHLELVEEFGGAYDSRDLQAYVTQVGNRLTQAIGTERRYTFTVLDDETPNAMSLPTGYVYVTRGLLALANSEAELAGVLAHEIAHVEEGHAVARVRQAVRDGLAIALLEAAGVEPELAEAAALQALARQMHYSREQEHEADIGALRIMAAAGYEPRALVNFLQTLTAQDRLHARLNGHATEDALGDFLASHPRTDERVDHLGTVAAGIPAGGRVGREQHLRLVDGMIYGEDPSRGVVRGNRFLHPGQGFTFAVPEGFAMANTDDTVLALHPTGALILFDADEVAPDADMAGYLEQGWMPGVDLYDLGTTAVGGMPAATAAVRISSNLGPMHGRVVAVRFDAETVYRFLLALPVDGSRGLERAQAETVASFRRLSPAEAAAVRPYRLRVVEVPPGMPVEQLATIVPGAEAVERLRILNALEPGEALPGGLAKIYAD